MTAKEKAKVTHDINNVYHAKYKGKSSCYIRTHANEPDSPVYVYRFRNHGFDDYEIHEGIHRLRRLSYERTVIS